MTPAADPVVFRTLDPGVVARWTAYEADSEDWMARAKAFAAEVDPDHNRTLRMRPGILGPTLAGLESRAYWPVPAGWQQHPHDPHVIVPTRTRAGNHAATRLAALRPPSPLAVLHDSGMPDSAAVGDRFVRPGVQRLTDGAIYTRWPMTPDPAPDARWERVRLSAFYALLEAMEDAAQTKTPSR